ncbi:hypothetical protein E2C01_060291 [Portunus trituberculatus]|uniref:Uncharacterized protein n=1 Tax=Portunus trituberculatus TaxID=210409 RepID=A0A5B7H8B3_PORTR|nr:hypothetical protein [Portunus trituberculatus]
MMNSSPAQN